jgi:PKD repeat protein
VLFFPHQEAGVLSLGITRTNGNPGANGTGKVVLITLKVKPNVGQNRVTELTFRPDSIQMKQPNGDAIPEHNRLIVGAVQITVSVNQPPLPKITAPEAEVMGARIKFDGSESKDPDGTIVEYQWNFGDGKVGNGMLASHTYTAAGKYTVRLTVVDNEGAIGEETKTILIVKKPPEPYDPTPKTPMLKLTGEFPSDKGLARCSIDVWEGNLLIGKGQFLEYQIKIPAWSASFQAGVDLRFSDGATLGNIRDAAGERAHDQNGWLAAPTEALSKLATDRWYHRIISLDLLAGRTVVAASLAIDSDTHQSGSVQVWVDNIAITDEQHNIAEEIFVDKLFVHDPTPEIQGIRSVQVDPLAVHPKGKLTTTWGKIKVN